MITSILKIFTPRIIKVRKPLKPEREKRSEVELRCHSKSYWHGKWEVNSQWHVQKWVERRERMLSGRYYEWPSNCTDRGGKMTLLWPLASIGFANRCPEEKVHRMITTVGNVSFLLTSLYTPSSYLGHSWSINFGTAIKVFVKKELLWIIKCLIFSKLIRKNFLKLSLQ